jgi:hypothetical protein
VACVASSSPNATSAGVFLPWEKAENTTCADVLTSALLAETPDGTVSLEFGFAELGWWLSTGLALEANVVRRTRHAPTS